MIYSNRGTIEMEGELSVVMGDLTLIIRKLRKIIEKDIDAKTADEAIYLIAQLAYSSEEELKDFDVAEFCEQLKDK